ncbi:VOC family protein [Nocardioides marmoraquaticus]
MTHIQSFDHVGVTVADLDAAIDFFTRLGLEVEGRQHVEGEFLDTVIGMTGAKTEIAMLRPPGGGTALELSTFVRPDVEPGSVEMATRVGLRNVCFVVDDLRGILDELAADGFELVGGAGNHEDTWLMAYVRGPEGIIVSLTERIG